MYATFSKPFNVNQVVINFYEDMEEKQLIASYLSTGEFYAKQADAGGQCFLETMSPRAILSPRYPNATNSLFVLGS